MGLLNARMRSQANLNCDKLRISDIQTAPNLPPMQCIQDERIFLGGSYTLSVSGKANCFDLEEKVTGPFVRLLPVFAVWSRCGGGKH